MLHQCSDVVLKPLTSNAFLRQNLEWLSRATNWAKFSATAGLGVIHSGHLAQVPSIAGLGHLLSFAPASWPPAMKCQVNELLTIVTVYLEPFPAERSSGADLMWHFVAGSSADGAVPLPRRRQQQPLLRGRRPVRARPHPRQQRHRHQACSAARLLVERSSVWQQGSPLAVVGTCQP